MIGPGVILARIMQLLIISHYIEKYKRNILTVNSVFCNLNITSKHFQPPLRLARTQPRSEHSTFPPP